MTTVNTSFLMLMQSGISFIMRDGFTIMNGLLVGYILISNSKQNQIKWSTSFWTKILSPLKIPYTSVLFWCVALNLMFCVLLVNNIISFMWK